ncbi:ABC transporter ATP-binding protein [Pseudomonas sp. DP-17]|uniref:ABC transporter ATP-binding protein n=1 Tax=Pseudomonas sp. DP-17 TaxID=1580486 RepID=UPI001EFBE9DE|nr:ABC transporter ATP-binding protein [Pseudomonas sp. DP-17]MCG8910865.1 ABC transporter ATP-binding protein [Pseudomonas sp. DP-17]
MSSKTLIDVQNLSKCFHIYDSPAHRFLQFVVPRFQRLFGAKPRSYAHDFWALKDVSFQIRRGETVGIIGRNGSGKSTLLQIICGTLNATSGMAVTNGRIAALLELGAGFNPEFTGRDNVFLAGSIAGISQDEMRKRFSEIEAFADIGEFIDQPVKTYSSGMFVRLAFSTAIHTSPELLVVDEALAVGDTAFQTKCLTRIRELQKGGTTILLVTHSTNTLIEYCDRAIYLKRGTLIEDGPCREVVKHYANDLVEEEGGIAVSAPPVESVSETSEINIQQEQPETIARLSILNVAITDTAGNQRSVFSYNEEFLVRVDIRNTSSIHSPCFGMQIKSTDDIVLWSATTQQLGFSSEHLEIGVHQLVWRCKASFSGNRYVLAIGAGDVESGEYKRHARLAYAGHIDILPQEHGGSGWLAPCPVVTISQARAQG